MFHSQTPVHTHFSLCAFQTLAEQLIDAVDLSSAHNYTLLLLWASQANAVPVRADVCIWVI